MWPTLLKFGDFEITTFGLMMFLAFVVGGMLLSRQFRHYGLDEDHASTILLAAAVGGILGGKLYYAILYKDMSLMFTRAGLVWYGGFLGGALLSTFVMVWKKLDFFRVSDAAAPCLAMGYMLGRIGCFLVGDDYGRPTDSALGIAFPKGAPPTTADNLREFGAVVDPALPGEAILRVHPTQIYEAVAGLLIFAILWPMSRRPHRRGTIWALFLMLASIERFLVEFLRAKDDRFFGPFTVAQVISVILFLIGAALLVARRRGSAPLDEARAV